jgi:prophage regulatory protein
MSARDQFDFNQLGTSAKAFNLLRLPEVSKRVSLGRTKIYDLIKLGRFPRPVKAGGASAWVDMEITQWIQSLMSARDEVATKTRL